MAGVTDAFASWVVPIPPALTAILFELISIVELSTLVLAMKLPLESIVTIIKEAGTAGRVTAVFAPIAAGGFKVIP